MNNNFINLIKCMTLTIDWTAIFVTIVIFTIVALISLVIRVVDNWMQKAEKKQQKLRKLGDNDEK